MNHLQSIRGMHDILPADSAQWSWLERRVRDIMEAYNFREIRTPMLEPTELFARGIGQGTDVVEKEMYTFSDRSDQRLSLRPEGTAGVVRSAIQHGLLQSPGLKVWYQGPMFRYERPQKGRQRQFFQFGAEVFGVEQAAVDVQLIALVERLWRSLGLSDRVRLEINSLGDPGDRVVHRRRLLDYLERHRDRLDADSQRRMETNPLRIFDAKHPETRAIMADAPRLIDHLGEPAQAHFEELCTSLSALGVEYQVNTALVRGLDYYSRTVFEWTTDELGAQGTVCAGGRYDGLVELLGGRAAPGIGFAMGAERLLALLEGQGMKAELRPHACLLGTVPTSELLQCSERLFDSVAGLRMETVLSGGSFKSQFKRADRSGARWAIILGEEELANGLVQIKDLRDRQAEQISMPAAQVAAWLQAAIHAEGRF